jgi:hypothetical protein
MPRWPLRAQRWRDKMQSPLKYYLLMTPETIDMWEFDNPEALLAKLRELQEAEKDSPAYNKVFIYSGQRLLLTKGPFKHLLLPDGSKVPVFMQPDVLEVDTEGYLTDPVQPQDLTEDESVEEEVPSAVVGYDMIDRINSEPDIDWDHME